MTILITGASAGFGAAIARRFALEGSRLVLAARRGERLRALAQSLKAPAHVVELDVRDSAAVASAIQGLPADFADIEVLINNAGLALGLEPAHQAALEDWERMVDTNIKGLMYVTRAVLPSMVERGRGHVVNIGSIAGEWPYPGGNVYGASKAFVRQFSLNLRADLLGTPLRVTDIEPGLCSGTEFSQVRFHGDEARAAKVYDNVTPLTAEDVAETVHWVTSRPPHVNINTISLMPVAQAFSPLAVHRRTP